MLLDIPRYIESTGIVDEPITHEWDDSDEEEVLLDQPRLMGRLNQISYRGVLAFSIGITEWVVWRLSQHLNDDDTPFLAIQASWAGMIEWRYLKSLDISELEEELDEPIGGPLALAFKLLTDVFIEARRVRPVSQNAAPLSEIPIKLIPNPDVYKAWRRTIIGRLTQMYPMKQDDRLGSPVPREALDPNIDFRPEIAPEFLVSLLRRCDPKKNHYLSSPKEMIADGFQGKPYSL